MVKKDKGRRGNSFCQNVIKIQTASWSAEVIIIGGKI